MKNPFFAVFIIAVFLLFSCEQNSLEENSTSDSLLSLYGIGGINSFTGTAVAIEQAGTQVDPTNAAPVTFTIVFTEAVDPVTFDDTDIIQNGTATGVTWFLSTADNITWILEYTAIATSGTLVPTIAAGTVQDIYGNDNRASTSTDNIVTYDTTTPTVTINQSVVQTDPSNDTPIVFTVVFSEAINPATFTIADIVQGGSAIGITWSAPATSNNITWTLGATSVSTPGTLIPSIAASMVQDAAGNPNSASTSTDNSVTYDIQAPTISMFTGPGTTNVNNISVGITAGDNVGITGWMITETSTAPLLTDPGWQGTQPASYTFSGGPGTYWLYLWARDGAGNISAMSGSACFLVIYQSIYPAPPLRTGQTECYTQAGAVVACTGTGQDGNLQKGLAWPSPRFTVNGLTVTDNLTGLVWTTNANLMDTTYSFIDNDDTAGDGLVYWQTALDFAAQLRADNYGGRSDWRLANIAELMSLMNFGSGLIRTWFTSFGITYPVGTVSYWSSTSYYTSPGNAWTYRHYTSAKNYAGKSVNAFYAWAVAGTSTVVPQTGQTLCYNSVGATVPCASTGQDGEYQSGVAWVPATRFVNNLDGTITDDLTGLMWVEDVNAMVSDYPLFDMDGTANDGWVTWQHALDYVAMLNSGAGYLGYTDWRLPNVNELLSLQNQGDGTNWLYDRGFNSIFPELPQAQTFWSSTTYEITGFGANAKIVNDVYNNVGNQPKSNTSNYYTWPVRGGN